MPGVLLDRVHGADDRLAGRACSAVSPPCRFSPASRKAKFRTLVFPGDALEFEGSVVHEGSGYTVAECEGPRDGSQSMRRRS